MPRDAGFLVFLRLPPAEIDALNKGFRAVLDEEEHTIHENADGSTDLLLLLVARSLPHAKKIADDVWLGIREAAGLAFEDAVVTAISPYHLIDREPRHVELLRAANELVGEKKNELAIIVAQTACEIYIEDIFGRLLVMQMPSSLAAVISKSLRQYSLLDGRAQELWEALTGFRLTDEDFFKNEYRNHVERRHGIAHRGEEATREDAEQSLAAVNRMIDYVAQVWASLVPATDDDVEPPQPLDDGRDSEQ